MNGKICRPEGELGEEREGSGEEEMRRPQARYRELEKKKYESKENTLKLRITTSTSPEKAGSGPSSPLPGASREEVAQKATTFHLSPGVILPMNICYTP